MKEEILKAIIELKSFSKTIGCINYGDLSIEPEMHDVVDLCIEIMLKELDRLENEALTLSELKEMVGEPVWVVTNDDDKYMAEWEIVSALNFDLNDAIIEFKGGWNVEYDYCTIYKHKPTEGGGEISKWISTEDKLPSEDKQYLCRYTFRGHEGQKFIQVLDYYLYDEIPHFQHELGIDGMKVTHWYELPEFSKGNNAHEK